MKQALLDRPLVGALLIAMAGIVFYYFEVIQLIANSWQSDEYSHGYLIPVIALLIARMSLQEASPAPKPSVWGAGLLVAALLLKALGDLTANNSVAEYSLLVGLAGLILACLGSQVLRAVLPALVYLVFAIPLPSTLFARLTSGMQLLSSTLGVAGLEVFGLPVYQEGNVIDLGEMQLQVAEACSGLRYLFPLMSFGYLAAVMMKGRWWKRAVLFLSTIPISILINSLRISLIGVSVELWGIQMAQGVLHDFEGWTMFMVCTALLALEIAILRAIGSPIAFRFELFSVGLDKLLAAPAKLSSATLGCLAALAGASLLQVFVLSSRVDVVPQRTQLTQFPLQINGWIGRPEALSKGDLQSLKLDDYFMADFTDPSGLPPVNFYVAYYASQRRGAAPHSPEICIPGGGWLITTLQTYVVPGLGTDRGGLKVNRAVIKKGENTELVYFWLQERGRDLTGEFETKWYLLRDAMLRRRTDGALVRAVTMVRNPNDTAAADDRLRSFLAQTLPLLSSYVPD